jgi:hypothetical protein
MADFGEALKQGLEAAEAMDRARKEIDVVFGDLNKQLLEKTEGKISIVRKQYEMKRVILEAFTASLVDMLKPKETYWAIVAFNPSLDNSPVKELARWSIDRAGYPCKIVWGGKELSCEDREALENSLAELLRDPLVAEKLYALMQLEEPKPEEGAAHQEDATDKE